MTRVDFYVCESRGRDRLGVTCQLVQKAYEAGQRVHVHAADAAEAEHLDDLLWTFRQQSFVPHARAGTAEAAHSPVVIDHGDEPREPYDLLFNLAAGVPPFFSRFERVIEVVDGAPERVAAGRERYRFYRDRGYPLSSTKL